MADIDITIGADDSEFRNVLGSVSKELINFARQSQSSFGQLEASAGSATKATAEYNKSISATESELKKISRAASSFPTPGTSSMGFSDAEIKAIQAGLADSTTEARKLAQELERASTTSLSDTNIRAIQAGLAESTRQASILSSEIKGVSDSERSAVEFLKDQVSQYDIAIAKQNEINQILDKRLSKSKEIELAAKPQSPQSEIGLTPEQVRQVQAALAESTTEAARLRDEFLKQNEALKTGTDLVKATGKELVKAFSKDIVKRASGDIVKYDSNFASFQRSGAKLAQAVTGQVRDVTKESGILKDLLGNISSLWDGIGNNGLPALRYAMYDIANNARRLSVASAAFAIAPVGFSIKYEREFANVVRTNEIVGDSMEKTRKALRADLLRITQTTPIPWEDITRIATLAGQLGIAQEVVGNFTETVAKFSATTDLTVDAAATAFGRLNQLIRGIDGQFDRLGSAILGVGVDSVATESQIVNVSTQIASMGNLVGLTAPEIVGLSGAIASLGIRPELARGNVTRLFSAIGKSAAEGGFRVEEFGRLTGRTADQFVDDWSSRPGEVLQDFFEGINREGPEAERTLRQLGITSVRDIPAILRLAQNSDEVRRLIELSSNEYLFATKVTEQYGVISSTTAEQIKRLGQNFVTLQSTIGDSVGPLSALFGLLNSVVEGFTAIAASPIGQVLSFIAIAVGLLAAAFFGMIATLAGSAAAILALRFAASKLGIELSGTTLKAILGSRKAMDALTISSGRATAAVSILRAAMRSFFILSAITAVFAGIAFVIGQFSQASRSAEENVERFFGSAEGLVEAIDKDTEAFNRLTGKMNDGTEAIKVFEREVQDTTTSMRENILAGRDYIATYEDIEESTDGASESTKEFADVAEDVASAQDKIAQSTRDATGAIDDNTRAVAENTLEYFRSGLLQDADLVNLFGDPALRQIFIDSGGDINELIAAGIQGNSGPLIDALVQTAKDARSALVRERSIAYDVLVGDELKAELDRLNAEIKEYDEFLKIADNTLKEYLVSAGDAVVQTERMGEATEFLSDETADLAERVAVSTDAINEITKALFGQANQAKKVEDALEKYAAALALTGDEANETAGEIQGVIAAILSEPDQNVDNILGNLAGLLVLLESQGPATAAAQELVRKAIEEVGVEANLQTPNVIAYAKSLNATANFDAANFQDLMASALKKTGNAASGASKKVQTLAEKFDDLVDSMFEVINLGVDAENAIFKLGEAFGETGDQALYASSEMQDAIGAILAQSDTAEQGVANLAALFSHLANVAGGQASPSLRILREAISQVGAQFGISEAQVQQFIKTAGGGLANINVDNFNRGIKNAQKEVRTLLDFASDLQQVFSRAFDIRFARTTAIDSIAEAWEKFTDNVQDARYELDELRASQEGIGADRGIKEYFLSIAEAYSDTVRAAQLRKEIAELDRQEAKARRDLERAQQIADADASSQGAGSRQNRQALLGLVKNYQDYITALAESGASQSELTAATEKARREFTQQARELGFQEADIRQYAAAFDDVQTAISNVERNITVEANVNPALQALNELNASLNTQIQAANDLNRALNQPVAQRSSGSSGADAGAAKAARKVQLESEILALQRSIANLSRQGNFGPSYNNEIARLRRAIIERQNKLASGNYAQGGFTGRGGKMEPAGIVHRGEYVIPKQFVNQSSGMPDPSFLAQMQSGMRNYFAGGFVGGGSAGNDGTMMVELSPFDRKLLADAGNVQLRLNGRVVAEATNQNNFEQARRGSD